MRPAYCDAYIALGSNLGDRSACIHRALALLDRIDGVGLIRVSTIIETKPVGPGEQRDYLNAVCLVRTDRPARELLDLLLTIERACGRDRSSGQRWGPRTLDLDLLVYGDQVIDDPGLTVPHPRLAERTFVLGPLNELAPDLVVPGTGRTTGQLLLAATDAGAPGVSS